MFFSNISWSSKRPQLGALDSLMISIGPQVFHEVTQFYREKTDPSRCIFGSKICTRWAPTSYKWSYNPYKWPYNWVTGVITPISGLITILITGRGPV